MKVLPPVLEETTLDTQYVVVPDSATKKEMFEAQEELVDDMVLKYKNLGRDGMRIVLPKITNSMMALCPGHGLSVVSHKGVFLLRRTTFDPPRKELSFMFTIISEPV